WHDIVFWAKGNTFQMFVDGVEVSAFRDEESRLKQGSISLGLREGSSIDVSDIEINESPRGIAHPSSNKK
ncbi:MAG TPA: hypothetical protein VMR25_08580, partial [Planctomycetaceae bacterium]|nr:hypothetical protein [Planctomycetaceae bacterium]